MADRKPKKSNALKRTMISPLAQHLAQAREGYVRYYQEAYNLERSEAEMKVDDYVDRAKARILEGPPDQIGWIDFSNAGRDEEENDVTRQGWQRLYDYAFDEIESGWRAAKTIAGGFDFGPLDRARFLMVREALRVEWKPSIGSESTLVDMLAQIQVAWEHWFYQHMSYVQVKFVPMGRVEEMARRDGEYFPPRVSEKEAYELSASMIDRFNKLYMRTLRALRDLRRMSPQIVVQNATQINVGEKQINIADSGPNSTHADS